MSLTDSELARLAGISIPVLKAIRAVESGSNPRSIRFEPHVFLRDTSPVCRGRTPPCTSSEIIENAIYAPSQIPYTPTRGAVSLVPEETNRAAFERAYALDPRAAIRATSWGSYQVLGGKLLALYGNDPERAVAAFRADATDVSNRLLVKWMQDNPTAVRAANEQDWYEFVHRFNGCTDCSRYLSRFEAAYRAALGGGGGLVLVGLAMFGGWWLARRRGGALGSYNPAYARRGQKGKKRGPRGALPKWRVEWINPDSGQWETYSGKLSRAAAQRLSRQVTDVLTPRWYNRNVPSRVVMEPGT